MRRASTPTPSDALAALRERLATHVARNGWRQIIIDYITITLGAVVLALANNLFFVPNEVVSGGITGIGIISHHLIGTPVGLVTLLLNVPLFIAGLRWAGGFATGVRTIYATLVMSVAIDLTAPLVPDITDNPLLFITYGGLLDGLGVGMVLRAQGTTAGTDIVARLLHHFTGLEVSRGMFISNALIITAAAIVFGLEKAMYGVIVAGVSAWSVNTVLAGGRQARQAFIISERWEEVRDALLMELARGVTIVPGVGAYTGKERQMLMCIISPREVAALRRLVHIIDPEAFVVIGFASEVYGEGFYPIDRM